MELIWIPITMFAALMQAVRTAGQKTLNQNMSTLGTTYVRSLFGLPVMGVYLAALLALGGYGVPAFSGQYFVHAALGALAQVVATMLLIYMFRLRNFVVGTMLTKSDILMTAVIGGLFFSETLSGAGWLALLVVLSGVFLMLIGRLGIRLRRGAARFDGPGRAGETVRETLLGRPTQVALTCALSFAFSYLFLREAMLDLGRGLDHGLPMWRGAWTVVVATGMQVAGLGLWLLVKERSIFSQIWRNRGIAGFIGVTSALGSIGWYTAFAMQNASYVRAVGQIEAVFTLLISWAYFKERISGLEFAGILLTVTGVVIFRLL